MKHLYMMTTMKYIPDLSVDATQACAQAIECAYENIAMLYRAGRCVELTRCNQGVALASRSNHSSYEHAIIGRPTKRLARDTSAYALAQLV